MGIAAAVLLAVLAIVVVVYPFFRSRRSQSSFQSADIGTDRTEEAALDEIRALQLDWELGRVSEEEYLRRLNDYRVRAASLLRERDLMHLEADAALEAEIFAARSSMHDDAAASDDSRGATGDALDSHEDDSPST